MSTQAHGTRIAIQNRRLNGLADVGSGINTLVVLEDSTVDVMLVELSVASKWIVRKGLEAIINL